MTKKNKNKTEMTSTKPISYFMYLNFFVFIQRFSGVPPNNLGKNIKLVDWMPQNDLLGESFETVPDTERNDPFCIVLILKSEIVGLCPG